MSIISKKLELSDPNPNIQTLFKVFNKDYFQSKLTDKVDLKWSSRMTVCAGACTYSEGRNGCACLIQLSIPILCLRSRRDLVETLLHEMIHAYVYTLYGPEAEPEEHGEKFIVNMKRINKRAGTKITVFNSFDEEVTYFQSHWWKCNSGECIKTTDEFAIIKKSINRAPSTKDNWWIDHRKICSGNFIKIKEPEWKVSVLSNSDNHNTPPRDINKVEKTCPSKCSGTKRKRSPKTKLSETTNVGKRKSFKRTKSETYKLPDEDMITSSYDSEQSKTQDSSSFPDVLTDDENKIDSNKFQPNACSSPIPST